MKKLCGKSIASRSRYNGITKPRCLLPVGHDGKCDEFPFLKHLQSVAPRVAAKVKRDAVMTTGASWKSDDAGPNRILRWVMLLSDADLKKKFGIDMAALPKTTQAKLREKAATYDDSMEVAMMLTWLVYQMKNAPDPDEFTKDYLEDMFGPMQKGYTTCEICKVPLDFSLFELAKRGRAEIETCHRNPREHNAQNVGFGHRFCNVAQGEKTLDEFYDWVEGVLERASRKGER